MKALIVLGDGSTWDEATSCKVFTLVDADYQRLLAGEVTLEELLDANPQHAVSIIIDPKDL